MELGIPFPISVGRLWYANLQKYFFVDDQDAVNSRCWNMWTHVGILYSTCSTFPSRNGFMSRGCRPERMASSADTTWRKCATTQSTAIRDCRRARFNCLLWIYRMCLSNSDIDIQSVGYNSAQSPTNWESIHGKDPSILCRLSSRLSIALDDKNPKCEIQACGLT